MKCEFIGQSAELIGYYGGDRSVESAAKTCTQSKEASVDRLSAFVCGLLTRGHMSPLEFGFADVLIECDRAIQQELTRHRLFSFNVESTRWCDYRKKPLRFVTKSPKGMDVPDDAVRLLEELCEVCALVYETMLDMGAPRDYARKAFPLALASRMRMAGNFRMWLDMFPKRLSKAAHPEVRELIKMVRDSMRAIPFAPFRGDVDVVVDNG